MSICSLPAIALATAGPSAVALRFPCRFAEQTTACPGALEGRRFTAWLLHRTANRRLPGTFRQVASPTASPIRGLPRHRLGEGGFIRGLRFVACRAVGLAKADAIRG